MNKGVIIIILLAAVIFILTGILVLMPKNNQPIVQKNTNPNKGDGIEIISPKANEAILSPVKITGIVSGNGWTGFEGQVGTVHLLDASKKELAVTYLPATTEWTTLPTNFEASLNFSAISGSFGFLVFHNENPSGDPARDKTFTMPVTFK